MRFSKSVLFTLLSLPLLVAAPLLAQDTNAVQNKKVLGYQDPQTGAFQPLAREVPEAASTAPTTGTVTLTLNITVKSKFPTGTSRTIVCSSELTESTISTSFTSSSMNIENASVNATGSGTTYTCTVSIPYSWILPSSSYSTSLTGDYTVEVVNTANTAAPALLRYHASDFMVLSKIPANGVITSYTLNVTL